MGKNSKKFDIVKAIKRKGRSQQLEWEKTHGKLRAKIIDKTKTSKQIRKDFKEKTIKQIIQEE
jgi:hypothetical protein